MIIHIVSTEKKRRGCSKITAKKDKKRGRLQVAKVLIFWYN